MVAILFTILLAFFVLLNLINLPGNWICILAVTAWYFLCGNPAMDLFFWVLVLGCAILGEVLEWVLLANRAKKAHASNWGTFGGMVGAFALAILGSPFFFGLGALIGAILGAFLGCLVMELILGKSWEAAVQSGFGTMVGRLLGAVAKCGAGAAIVALTARRITVEPEIVVFEKFVCSMVCA